MGKLILVVGNSGVGKTTLVQRLLAKGNFVTGLEQHGERPFQHRMSLEPTRWGFANQIDYLLLRAEQEQAIRQDARTGLQDGGLEVDYYVFNHRFHQLGYMNDAEFALCTRVYHFIRRALPPPDLIIHLRAPLQTIVQRFTQRNRALEIAKLSDLEAMSKLLAEWLASVRTIPIIDVNVAEEDESYANILAWLVPQIERLSSYDH